MFLSQFGNCRYPLTHGPALPVAVFVRFHLLQARIFANRLVHDHARAKVQRAFRPASFENTVRRLLTTALMNLKEIVKLSTTAPRPQNFERIMLGPRHVSP